MAQVLSDLPADASSATQLLFQSLHYADARADADDAPEAVPVPVDDAMGAVGAVEPDAEPDVADGAAGDPFASVSAVGASSEAAAAGACADAVDVPDEDMSTQSKIELACTALIEANQSDSAGDLRDAMTFLMDILPAAIRDEVVKAVAPVPAPAPVSAMDRIRMMHTRQCAPAQQFGGAPMWPQGGFGTQMPPMGGMMPQMQQMPQMGGMMQQMPQFVAQPPPQRSSGGRVTVHNRMTAALCYLFGNVPGAGDAINTHGKKSLPEVSAFIRTDVSDGDVPPCEDGTPIGWNQPLTGDSDPRLFKRFWGRMHELMNGAPTRQDGNKRGPLMLEPYFNQAILEWVHGTQFAPVTSAGASKGSKRNPYNAATRAWTRIKRGNSGRPDDSLITALVAEFKDGPMLSMLWECVKGTDEAPPNGDDPWEWPTIQSLAPKLQALLEKRR